MSNIQAPKGTRDFYPDEMRQLRHILDIWSKICRSYGFEEYEGPTFEHLELFTEKSGDEIVTQLYNFKDKGDRDLALRPELTPTLARMVNQKGPALKLPIRWYSAPRLFRYERAQKGRLREFFQLNMDIIGTDSNWAEVDLLCAIVDLCIAFGLQSQDFAIKVSSRRLLSTFLSSLGVGENEKLTVYAAMDRRLKVPKDVFHELLAKAQLDGAGIAQVEAFFACKGLDEIAKLFTDSDFSASVEELKELFLRLQSLGYGDYVDLDLSVVRGLAYYTGIVFEVYDKGHGLRAMAGGGRYDNLLQKLGGRPLSGVGFGMGDVVLLELLKEKNLVPTFKNRVDYFVVSFTGELNEIVALAKELRAKGLTVTYALEESKLKKQLSLADEVGARKVLFIGSDKAAPGSFEVKDLESGEQKILTLGDL